LVIKGSFQNPAFSYGEVTQSAQVNLPVLIDRFRQSLIQSDRILETTFDHQKLETSEHAVGYGVHRAKGIIFCEGQAAVDNPYFNDLPFRGAKGEVLIIRIPDTSFEKILKHRVFITPLGDGTYWIGSAYINQYTDDLPTKAGKQFLLDRLADILKVPFELVEHRSAIRPTVKDRRPFLGTHPHLSRLHLFNGLGTKGASLGPFWAKALCEYLTQGQALDAAVDIRRFAQA
jgi:glycine/D-amino acid oxidase-like deaminating enzyme